MTQGEQKQRVDLEGREAVWLREVIATDLEAFFAHQLDPEANYMAAFTAKDPSDRAAFEAHWAKLLADPTIILRTIMCTTQVVGHIGSFEADGERELTYWLDKAVWGRGIASTALTQFLEVVSTRPLSARVAKDHAASRRVLEKCGFVVVGEAAGFAQARGAVITELILQLSA